MQINKDIQKVVGTLLRVGVFTALILSILGAILYLRTQAFKEVHFEKFTENHSLFSLKNVFDNRSIWDGIAFIKLGIIVLIITPIARICFTLFAFLLEKDYLYSFVSVIVLTIILTSMLMGVVS